MGTKKLFVTLLLTTGWLNGKAWSPLVDEFRLRDELVSAQVQKDSKKAAKELTSAGWSVVGGKSMREAMDAHYQALGAEQNLTTIEGHATAKDVNHAIRRSQYDATQKYALMMGSKVEGTTETKMNTKNDGEKATGQVEVVSNFRSSTKQSVKLLKPSVVFIKNTKDGRVEVLSLFIVKIQ